MGSSSAHAQEFSFGLPFEQLVEAMPEAIVGVDRRNLVAYLNSQAESLFGYQRDELLGEPVELLLPGRFQDLTIGKHELFARRRDASEFPAEVSLFSIETEFGPLATATVRDISQYRAAERKFEQLLEFAPDAIIGVAPSGEIALVNQQAESLFGYRPREMIGESVESIELARQRLCPGAEREAAA